MGYKMYPQSNRWTDIYHANLFNAFIAEDCELINNTFELENPLDNLVESFERGFRQQFSDVMYRWIATGQEDITREMLNLNPNAAKFGTRLELDGKYTIITAYGPRIDKQMDYIKGELERDPNSRRACIMLLGSEDQYVAKALAAGKTKCEYVCTYGFNFRIRKGRLDMVGTMRSNNYTTTVCQDVYVFTRLQQDLARCMNLEVGKYYHSTVSGHVFAGEEGKAARILAEYLYHPSRVEKLQLEQRVFEARTRVLELERI